MSAINNDSCAEYFFLKVTVNFSMWNNFEVMKYHFFKTQNMTKLNVYLFIYPFSIKICIYLKNNINYESYDEKIKYQTKNISQLTK